MQQRSKLINNISIKRKKTIPLKIKMGKEETKNIKVMKKKITRRGN